MSSEKDAETLVMAESLIPSDLTTPTLGSNYCLEGFEDMAYGVGVLEGVKDPSLLPPPAVPSGLSKDGSEGMTLTAYMEETASSIVNHDWLADAVQDPERLPERPVSIPELEEAWGQNNWAAATPHFDQDLRTAAPKSASKINLVGIAQKAMRRSASGVSFSEITREAVLSAGGDESKVAGILKAVEEEHGLAGKVFIRSAAYPGYETGKWKDHIKKHAASAQYLVVSAEELRNSSWIVDGRCTLSGKKAVLSVPWGAAAAFYTPRLKAAGYVLQEASSEPRGLLKAAFLSGPQRKQGNPENLPRHSGDVSRLGAEHISSNKALAAFEGRVARNTLAKIARVEAQIEKGLRGDLLRNFIASTFTPSEQKMATGLLSSVLQNGSLLENPEPKRVAYEDTGLRPNRPISSDPSRAQFDYVVKQAVLWAHREAPSIEGSLVEAVSAKYGEAVSRRVASVDSIKELQRVVSIVDGVKAKIAQGACGDLLRSIIARSFKPSEMKIATRLLAPILTKTGALKNSSNQRAYADTGLRPNVPVASTFDADFERRIQGALKWAADSVTASLHLRDGVRVNFPEEVARKVFERKAFLELEAAQKSVREISSEIGRGSRGSVLRNFIAKTVRPEHRKIASRMLRDVLDPSQLENTAAETKRYAGVEFKQNSTTPTLVKNASGNDARMAVLWIKRAMNEGFAGRDLDSLIEKRFSSETIREAFEEIRSAREAHEGAAGFMYVDSQTYASPAGSTGCEKGALKHRANQLKMVLSMPRCGSCALARALPDGTMKCGTYNKVLVSPSDLSDEAIQMSKQAHIKGAEQTDAEATASMFAPSWKNDFQLHNAALDDIQALPEDEKVASIISFGTGMSW